MLFVEHLQILGLQMGCSWEDAREAHRTLIKLWHPDRFPTTDPRRVEAERRSKALNRAIAELRPFLTSAHYAKRQLGKRVSRSQRAVYNDASLSWASRSGSYPTMSKSVRKAIIPSHVTLLKNDTTLPERKTQGEKSESERSSLGSSGRWKSFVGEMQAKLKSVTGSD